MRLGPALLLVALLHVCSGASSNSFEEDSIFHARNATSTFLPVIESNSLDENKNNAQTRVRYALSSDEGMVHAFSKIKGVVQTPNKEGIRFYNNKDTSNEHNSVESDEEHAEMRDTSKFSSTNLAGESLRMESPFKKKELTVGYLAAVRGELKERQGLTISGAITMALNKFIPSSSSIITTYTLLRKLMTTLLDYHLPIEADVW
ncbi:hypothetical protein HHI36_007742 [Cryptolaemus montrouzieri]|uniref:Uncharacterized protein n=1 Tax=Cryptolaemus montrouzieri TaxID=559131 RepID=A0ABD2MQG9_9CUCU